MEIMSIALPAAVALAADPITSLVDTAFVGHLGSAELAAVGVSISIFNLVAKLLNISLLNIFNLFVAEEQAVLVEADDMVGRPNKKFLPSVSTSLAMATAFGIVETIALSFGYGFLLNAMGLFPWIFANYRSHDYQPCPKVGGGADHYGDEDMDVVREEWSGYAATFIFKWSKLV